MRTSSNPPPSRLGMGIFALIAVGVVAVFAIAILPGLFDGDSRSAPRNAVSTTTPRATLSPEETAYTTDLQSALQVLRSNSSEVARQMGRAGDDVGLLDRPDFRNTQYVHFLRMQEAVSEIESLTPPPRFAAAHENYLLMTESYRNGADRLSRGIDARDAALIGSGADLLLEAAHWMNEGNDALP